MFRTALLALAFLTLPATASAAEEEVQAIVMESATSVKAEWTPGDALPEKGKLPGTKLVYRLKGEQVLFSADGKNWVVGTPGAYDIGEERWIVLGEDGRVLGADLAPTEKLTFLRKRPGRAKMDQ